MLRSERQLLWDQIRAGRWAGDAAVAVGLSRAAGERVFAQAGGVMEPRSVVSGRFLSHGEREEIALLHAQGVGVREIGRRIGRPHCTVSRELARNRRRDGSYRALTAQRRAECRTLLYLGERLCRDGGNCLDVVQRRRARIERLKAARQVEDFAIQNEARLLAGCGAVTDELHGLYNIRGSCKTASQ